MPANGLAQTTPASRASRRAPAASSTHASGLAMTRFARRVSTLAHRISLNPANGLAPPKHAKRASGHATARSSKLANGLARPRTVMPASTPARRKQSKSVSATPATNAARASARAGLAAKGWLAGCFGPGLSWVGACLVVLGGARFVCVSTTARIAFGSLHKMDGSRRVHSR